MWWCYVVVFCGGVMWWHTAVVVRRFLMKIKLTIIALLIGLSGTAFAEEQTVTLLVGE